MARLLLFLVLLCPLDVDPQLLIEQLGDDDPAVRDRAAKALSALGDAALGPLQEATDHPDAEIRIRASTLLREIDHTILLRSISLAQRPRKVRFFATDRDNAVAMDGGTFLFERRPWIVEGEPRGSVIRTRLERHLDGEIEWRVAAVRKDGGLPIETCADHSPAQIYVPALAGRRGRVVIKGVRRWLCDVPVVFRDPAEGDRRRIGPFTLILQWPEIVLECDKDFSPGLVTMMLDVRNIQARPYPDRPPPQQQQLLLPTDEPAIFFPEEQEVAGKAWCGCAEPSRSELPPATSRKRRVTIPVRGSYLLHHLESISVHFRIPVEEPFEVESPPLK